jgi:hypothetical protein
LAVAAQEARVAAVALAVAVAAAISEAALPLRVVRPLATQWVAEVSLPLIRAHLVATLQLLLARCPPLPVQVAVHQPPPEVQQDRYPLQAVGHAFCPVRAALAVVAAQLGVRAAAVLRAAAQGAQQKIMAAPVVQGDVPVKIFVAVVLVA